MRKFIVTELVSGVYAAAIEDKSSWDMPTYTNFYILRRGAKAVLIDAGMQTYSQEITAILKEIGLHHHDISHILLTHGHHDHVEGIKAFPNAVVYIHSLDAPMLGSGLSKRCQAYQPVREFNFAAAGVPDVDVVLVNSHTPGSAAIYDTQSKALFVGDFFCFFGETLPEGQFVSYAQQCREESYQYVADQAVESKADSARFLQGLSRLLAYQPEFLCTGHGVILKGEVQDFLTKLWKSGNGK